ncbi:MAG: hypothetical protein Q9228_006085 [Teloschistes exilis]
MTPSFVIWAGCLLGASAVSATSCNADNCLRALFPTQSPAVYSSDAAFCATFTTSPRTATTDFPSKASAACGTAPARYSSACSCRPTFRSTLSTTSQTTTTSSSVTSTTTSSSSSVTTSSTSTLSTSTSSTSTTSSPTATPCVLTGGNPNGDAVKNGGFECGLAPWIATDIANTAHSITSPGDASTYAYEFDQTRPINPTAKQNPASLNQNIPTVNGIPYNLRFRTYFDKCTGNEGFVGVKVNGQPVYTVDACDGTAGVFNDNLVQFFASSDSTNVRFEFLVGENNAVVKIDNVNAYPLH